MHTTIVGGRKKSDQLPLGKSFKSIHDTLVRSNNQLQFVFLAEFSYTIRLRSPQLM